MPIIGTTENEKQGHQVPFMVSPFGSAPGPLIPYHIGIKRGVQRSVEAVAGLDAGAMGAQIAAAFGRCAPFP